MARFFVYVTIASACSSFASRKVCSWAVVSVRVVACHAERTAARVVQRCHDRLHRRRQRRRRHQQEREVGCRSGGKEGGTKKNK